MAMGSRGMRRKRDTGTSGWAKGSQPAGPLTSGYACCMPLFALLLSMLPARAVDAAALPLDQHGFTHVVAAMVRDRDCAATVMAPLQLAVACAGGTGSAVSLARAWRMWNDDPTQRDQALRAAAGAADMVDRIGHPQADRLRMVIRSRAQLAALAKRRPADPPAAWPITEDLWALLVLDAPSALGFVGQTELTRLGMGREAARAQAVENLRLAFPAPVQQGDGPVYMLEADGAYDASLLLHPDLWVGRAQRAGGVLYAATPDPGVLLWADGAQPDALPTLRAVVSQAVEAGGSLGPGVVRWSEDGWRTVE